MMRPRGRRRRPSSVPKPQPPPERQADRFDWLPERELVVGLPRKAAEPKAETLADVLAKQGAMA
jgi:hypothetical protein